ncbi:hypothetical protein HN51_058284, partial [Arachis hypogaea]
MSEIQRKSASDVAVAVEVESVHQEASLSLLPRVSWVVVVVVRNGRKRSSRSVSASAPSGQLGGSGGRQKAQKAFIKKHLYLSASAPSELLLVAAVVFTVFFRAIVVCY